MRCRAAGDDRPARHVVLPVPAAGPAPAGQGEQIFEPHPSGLTEALRGLADDRRRQALRQARDDDRAPLADDDAPAWFAVQSQLAQALIDLLGDVRDVLAAAVSSGPPPAEASDEAWYSSYD